MNAATQSERVGKKPTRAIACRYLLSFSPLLPRVVRMQGACSLIRMMTKKTILLRIIYENQPLHANKLKNAFGSHICVGTYRSIDGYPLQTPLSLISKYNEAMILVNPRVLSARFYS